MAGDLDLVTLGIRVDARAGTAEIVSFTRATEQSTKAVEQQERRLLGLNGALRTIAGAYAGLRMVQHAAETVNLAARYETLGVVLARVGQTVGLTRGEMTRMEADLRRTGISAIEARSNIAKMIQSNLDLAQATKLARIAQDAAVIGNMNSSEAFASLIHGIQNGNTLILRNIGILVNFDKAHDELARTLGKEQNDLTELEKAQARANAVLVAGEAITGAYAASMETAGKQLNSATRYMEDMRVAVGSAFLPQYTAAVFAYAAALQFLAKNATAVSAVLAGLLTAITAIAGAKGIGLLVAGLASLGPVGWAVVAALTAAGVVMGTFIAKQGEALAANQLLRASVDDFATGLKTLTVAELEAAVAGEKLVLVWARQQAALAGEREGADTFFGRLAAAGGKGHRLPSSQGRQNLRAHTSLAEREALLRLAEAERALAAARAVQAGAAAAAESEAERARKARFAEWQEGRRLAAERKGWEEDEIARLDRLRTARIRAALGQLGGQLNAPSTLNIPVPDMTRNRVFSDARIEREARERREAAAIESARRELVAREQMQLAFLQRTQESLGNFFREVMTDGVANWRSLWGSFKDLAIRTISDVLGSNLLKTLAQRASSLIGFDNSNGQMSITGKLAGPLGWLGVAAGGIAAGRAGGPLGGAVGGALNGAALGSAIPVIGTGVGAVVGALTGLASGIFHSAKDTKAAAKAYAEALREMDRAWTVNLASFRRLGTPESQSQALARQNVEGMEALRKQAFEQFLASKGISGGVQKHYLDALTGPGGELKSVEEMIAFFEKFGGQGPTTPATIAIQAFLEQLYQLQDAFKANEAAAKELELAERAAAAARFDESIGRLEDFRRTLNLGGLSTLNPAQKRTEAMSAYEALVAKAMGGDTAAADSIPQAAQAFLEASRAVYASSTRYVADFDRVQRETGAIIELFKNRRTVEMESLAALTAVQEQTAAMVVHQEATVSVLQEGFTQTVASMTEAVAELVRVKQEIQSLREVMA